jgi:hypothetical protein
MNLGFPPITKWLSLKGVRQEALSGAEQKVLQQLVSGKQTPTLLECLMEESIAEIYVALTRLEGKGIVHTLWIDSPEYPVSSNYYRQRYYELTQRGQAIAHKSKFPIFEQSVHQSEQAI